VVWSLLKRKTIEKYSQRRTRRVVRCDIIQFLFRIHCVLQSTFNPHNLSIRGQTIVNRERISIKMANTWAPIINGSHRGGVGGGGSQHPVSFALYCNFLYHFWTM